jgi:hypothetical protein
MVRLTVAQAETLYDLIDRSYVSASIPFLPKDVFPGRDNTDNGKRRCCTVLTAKGLFTPHQHMIGYLVADASKCRDAWIEWRQHNPNVEFGG